MTYRSKNTDFTAHEKPYVNKIYFKYCNITVALLTVTENWGLEGEVIYPFKMPVKCFKLDQFDCEKLILDFIPAWREDVKIRSGLKEYDSAMLLYKYRGITRLNKWWFAWSEQDRIEDYHPEYTPELDKLRGIVEECNNLDADEIIEYDNKLLECLENTEVKTNYEFT